MSLRVLKPPSVWSSVSVAPGHSHQMALQWDGCISYTSKTLSLSILGYGAIGGPWPLSWLPLTTHGVGGTPGLVAEVSGSRIWGLGTGLGLGFTVPSPPAALPALEAAFPREEDGCWVPAPLAPGEWGLPPVLEMCSVSRGSPPPRLMWEAREHCP